MSTFFRRMDLRRQCRRISSFFCQHLQVFKKILALIKRFFFIVFFIILLSSRRNNPQDTRFDLLPFTISCFRHLSKALSSFFMALHKHNYHLSVLTNVLTGLTPGNLHATKLQQKINSFPESTPRGPRTSRFSTKQSHQDTGSICPFSQSHAFSTFFQSPFRLSLTVHVCHRS